jgi:hypothetical protein
MKPTQVYDLKEGINYYHPLDEKENSLKFFGEDLNASQKKSEILIKIFDALANSTLESKRQSLIKLSNEIEDEDLKKAILSKAQEINKYLNKS